MNARGVHYEQNCMQETTAHTVQYMDMDMPYVDGARQRNNAGPIVLGWPSRLTGGQWQREDKAIINSKCYQHSLDFFSLVFSSKQNVFTSRNTGTPGRRCSTAERQRPRESQLVQVGPSTPSVTGCARTPRPTRLDHPSWAKVRARGEVCLSHRKNAA